MYSALRIADTVGGEGEMFDDDAVVGPVNA